MSDTAVAFNVIAKDNASKTFGKIGAAITLGVAAAAAAAIKVAGDSIRAASDLAETQSKVGVIFGKSAQDVEKFASTAATKLGQSRQSALDAAASFAIFGKGAGLAGGKLVKFSTDMTGLASDMASFSNTSPEQAIEAIGAALRGESEPIRAYGVMLDEATLKSQALSMGLLKATTSSAKIGAAHLALTTAQGKLNTAIKEHGKNSAEATAATVKLNTAKERFQTVTEGTLPPLTQQQKVLAAQASIIAQTSAAHGDFARTSSGLANQQRILAAELANAKVELGQKLLPIVLRAVTEVSKLTTWVKANGDTIRPWAQGIGAAALAVGALVVVSKIAAAVGTAWNVVTATGTGIRAAYSAVVGLSTGTLATFIGVKYLELAAWVRTTAATIAAGVSMAAYAAWGAIVRGATLAWIAVQWLLNVALTANPIGLVVLAIALLVGAVVLAYNKVGWFRNGVNAAFSSIVAAGKLLWAGLQAVWNGLVTGFKWVVTHVAAFQAGVRAVFISVVSAALNLRQQIIGGFQSWVGYVLSIPGRIRVAAAGMFESITGAFRRAINWVIGKWNGLSFTVPSVSVGPVHFGGQTVGTPNVPYLASGGQVTSSGLAFIHRGETVTPAAQVQPAGRGSGGVMIAEVHVHLHGPVDGQQVLAVIETEARRNRGLKVPYGVVTTA